MYPERVVDIRHAVIAHHARAGALDPDLPVLIKPEEGGLGVVADSPERLRDGIEAIDQPVAIGKPRMTQHVCQAERVQRRAATIARYFVSQIEEHLRQQKIALDQFVNFRRLLHCAAATFLSSTFNEPETDARWSIARSEELISINEDDNRLARRVLKDKNAAVPLGTSLAALLRGRQASRTAPRRGTIEAGDLRTLCCGDHSPEAEQS